MSKPTPESSPEALHQAFTWLPSTHKNDEAAEFYALTKDISQGLQTCVDLAHFSTMDRDSDTTPVLDVEGTDRLLRLTITTLKMLAQVAAAKIDHLDGAGSKGG
ncbi:hypothetical protein [Glaciimonas sp. PAMC28666]|uniref:hypothetical protein n=1 Tax=Glaciimonas sp. PAMC28666 TaxID=2807626 RepID=UPI00196287CC|nr:hypothetical protein [Glaciimonas sp. PAMC28666]QRX84264.1 hypothetical protein JQN73_08810 [Glaciimonas sp. PAMC28666]